MKEIIAEDVKKILSSNVDFERFRNKSFLVTGATGLIGFNFVTILAEISKQRGLNIKLYALVRNEEKGKRMYSDICEQVIFVKGDVCETIECSEKIDYIIHAASQTSSKLFLQTPVETIKTSILGTINVMDFAKKQRVQSVLYLSTMEVYGSPESDELIYENHFSNIDTTSVRSCYPESKRLCENIVVSYGKEYGVSGKILRLTQTFGPGVNYSDGRVFADMARCVIERKNIILHTKGQTKRSYLYTADAVTAMLTVLLDGNDGEAYNAANEMTYCSIYEMACLVAEKCAHGEIKVEIELDDEEKYGYAPELHMNLSTAKLRKIGWKPLKNLENMFTILIKSMEQSVTNNR